jgi:hypothetical protein
MIAEKSTTVPNNLENRIEESARLKEELPHEIHNDMDNDDLDDLVAALPKTKIDFTEESEMGSEASEAISPMAKELLGENFDFDSLAKQTKQPSQSPAPDSGTGTGTASETSEEVSPTAKEVLDANIDAAGPEKQTKQPFRFLAPGNGTDAENAAEVAHDVQTLNIQEDEAGTVQVSSPFLVANSPQFADFTTPQTVLSTFSNDWVQETGGVVEPIAGDTSHFCFTEESQPMFIRKKRAN